MRGARLVALAILGGLTFGSLLVTAGYAWYWRSDRYREYCATVLGERLGLPCEIGQVVPRSRWAREFRDVRIWLPERRGEAAFCTSALLTYTADETDPDSYELMLSGGRSEISTRTWLREDYRFVLESGLRPGFAREGPRRVVFSGMDLLFERNHFRAALHDASGVISFDDPRLGHAHLTCSEFNGTRPAAPVVLNAAFSPQPAGIRLDHVQLDVPELPIAIVGLQALVGLDLHSGSFSGRLTYRETGVNEELTVSGKLFAIRLEECTRTLLERPWRGAAPEVELAQLKVVNGGLESVHFRSLFTDVSLGDLLAPWGLENVGGRLDRLYVDAAELSANGIDRFVIAGQCNDVALEQLSAALGWGRITGTAQLAIGDLTIEANHLASLDAEITVKPNSAHRAGYIERELLVTVLDRVGGISLPDALLRLLPERFPYTRLGVRFLVQDEMLDVLGTHGPHEDTILSAEIGGQEWSVLQAPAVSYDLEPLLDVAREQLCMHLERQLRSLTPQDAWRALSSPRPSDTASDATED